jgi:hypothetical protein
LAALVVVGSAALTPDADARSSYFVERFHAMCRLTMLQKVFPLFCAREYAM